MGAWLARGRRPNLTAQLLRVNGTIGVLLLLGSLFSSDHWAVLTPALYAALGLAWGWTRRSVNSLGAGAILAALALFEQARLVGMSVGPLWAGLGLALVLLETVTWEEGAGWLNRFTFGLGLATGTLGFFGLLGSTGQFTLILTGLLFGARSLRSPGALNPWLAFGSFYLAYLGWLGWSGPIEVRSLPLAAWLVLWYFKGFESCGALGVLVGLGPSLLGSFTSLTHAFMALLVALGLLGLGVARGRNFLRTAGGLGLLAEIGIQALHVAVQLPWQLVAAIVGVLLVSLGALFERRRQHRMRNS
jgi:hypothetical protein